MFVQRFVWVWDSLISWGMMTMKIMMIQVDVVLYIHSLKLTFSPLKKVVFQVRNLQTSKGSMAPIFRGGRGPAVRFQAGKGGWRFSSSRCARAIHLVEAYQRHRTTWVVFAKPLVDGNTMDRLLCYVYNYWEYKQEKTSNKLYIHCSSRLIIGYCTGIAIESSRSCDTFSWIWVLG